MSAKQEISIAEEQPSKPSLYEDPSSDERQPPKTLYARVYGFFGFTRAYNFPLFVIFAGALVGFSLSRLEYFNYDGVFTYATAPGVMLDLHSGVKRVGMLLHLASCLPAGLLIVWQFVPAIRRTSILFHRINGYFCITLIIIANISAGMLLGYTMEGGRAGVQTTEVMLIITTTLGLCMAYYNIKRLQIDQHRAWMLRVVFYWAAVITSRLFLNVAAVVVSSIGGYYTVWSCERVAYTYQTFGFGLSAVGQAFPTCVTPEGTLSDGNTIVEAIHSLEKPVNLGAAVVIPYAGCAWLAVFLHAIGVEIYLSMTPAEKRRLQKISYERQLAAGFKNPGNAGLTVERWGDA